MCDSECSLAQTSSSSTADLLITNEDPTLKVHLKGHKKAVTGLSFHPSKDQLVSSSDDNTIMLWNSFENIRSYNFLGHTDGVNCVDFAPNGKLIASGSQDKTVRLWIPNIKGGCSEFKAHTSPIRTVSFSSDSRKLVTGSNDKSVKVWDVRTKQFLCSFTGHNNWVRCARFTQDDSLIASCADDRTVRIWDRKSGQCVHVFACAKSSPNHLALHKSGNSLAVAMNSGSARIYDIKAQKLQQHYVLHNDSTCCAWHPLANYLLTSGKDGQIRVVDVMEGRPIYTLTAHENPITTIAFSFNGDYFASGGDDIFIWKTNFITSG